MARLPCLLTHAVDDELGELGGRAIRARLESAEPGSVRVLCGPTEHGDFLGELVDKADVIHAFLSGVEGWPDPSVLLRLVPLLTRLCKSREVNITDYERPTTKIEMRI